MAYPTSPTHLFILTDMKPNTHGCKVLHSGDFEQMIKRISSMDDWIIRALNAAHVIINLPKATSLQSVFASVIIYQTFLLGPLSELHICYHKSGSRLIIRSDPAWLLVLWNGSRNMIPTAITMNNEQSFYVTQFDTDCDSVLGPIF